MNASTQLTDESSEQRRINHIISEVPIEEMSLPELALHFFDTEARAKNTVEQIKKLLIAQAYAEWEEGPERDSCGRIMVLQAICSPEEFLKHRDDRDARGRLLHPEPHECRQNCSRPKRCDARGCERYGFEIAPDQPDFPESHGENRHAPIKPTTP